ncbi:MAG: hypothetical protein V1761_04145 [bacterium]
MPKKFGICLLALLVLFSFFALGLLLGSTFSLKWMPLIIGGGSFVVAILFLIASGKGRKNRYLVFVSVLFSGIGCGLSASAYYIHIDLSSLATMAVFIEKILYAAGASLGFYILYALSLNIRFLEKHIKLYTYPLMIAGLIALGILWGVVDPLIFSLLFFCFLMTVLFMFPLIIVAKDVEELTYHIAFAALGAVFLITVIVLIIISEGEGFDLDFGGGSGNQLPVENPHKSKINEIGPY